MSEETKKKVIKETKKDEKDSLQKLEIETELKKKESIDAVGLLEKGTESLKKEVDKKVEEFKVDVEELNKSYDEFDVVVTGVSSQILAKTNEIYGWFLARSKSLFKELRYLIIGATIIFGLVYFGVYGFQLNVDIVIWLSIIVVSIIFLYSAEERTKKNIEDNKEKLVSPINSVQNTASTLKGKNIKKALSAKTIYETLSDLTGIGHRIISATKAYIPALENYFNEREKRHKQIIFSNTFLKALKSYSIQINPKTDEYLSGFISLKNSEEEWLEDVSFKVSKFDNINPLILNFIYFDYTESKTDLKNTWSKIKEEKKLVEELVRLILSNENLVEYADVKSSASCDSIIQLIIDKPYISLSDFKEIYYKFYVELANKKSHLINTISDMGYNTDDIDSKIKKFIPSDSEEDKWEEELIKFSAKLIDIDSEILSLFFYEKVGNKKRKEIWYDILKNDSLFKNFVSFLFNKGKLKISENYEGQTETVDKVHKILEDMPEFDSYKVRNSIVSDFKDIDTDKDNIIQALNSFGFSLQSKKLKKDFEKFIPFSEDYTNEISEYIGKELNLSPTLIILFYGDRYDPQKRNKVFADIKKNSKESELATILVDKKLIKMETDSDSSIEKINISSILEASEDFNLVEIQNLYLNYKGLLDISKRASQFLYSEGLISNNKIDFKEIMSIIKNPMKNERLENIISIFDYLIRRDKKISNEIIRDVSVAASCIFLFNQGDVSSPSCCIKAEPSERTVKILYQNMTLKETGTMKKEQYTLSEIAKMVIEKSKELDYEYIVDFKLGLLSGYLYQSSKEMMRKKLNEMEEQMTQVVELKVEIEKMEISFKDFLNAELPEEFLSYAIQSQLIQAYVISTKSGRKPIFGQIIDVWLPEAYQQLSVSDSSFKNLLILARETIGHSTRIGVVPFNMDFEDFSKKFKILFDKAVEIYIERSGDKVSKSEFSINIFRFLASSATFKRIKLGAEKSDVSEEDNPIQIIKGLVIDKFNIEDNLSLVASSRDERERKIVVRKVIEELFDKKATIYSLIEKDLNMVSIRPEVSRELNSKEFDRKLYKLYNCSKFTELAKGIYNFTKEQKEEKSASALKARIKSIVSDFDVKPTKEETDSISGFVFKTFNNIGKAISY